MPFSAADDVVVFVDEASMLDPADALLIEQRCRKVVSIGDRHQLPPVGKPDWLGRQVPDAELTEVVRQAKGSAMALLGQWIRETDAADLPYHPSRRPTLPRWPRTQRKSRIFGSLAGVRGRPGSGLGPGTNSWHGSGVEPEPIRRGPELTLRELEAAFGPCAGMVLGYGEGEFGSDGTMRWCAALLPNDAMPRFVGARHAAELRGPFLIGIGSLKRASARGGVGEAVYGVALAADAPWPARELLHPDQMARPENLNERGEFRWQNGVPLLRAWLCWPPVPFADLTGNFSGFQRHHGIRVVPLDEVADDLHAAALEVPLREAVLDRPKPLPEAFWRPLRVREGGLRLRTVGERERSREARSAALLANRARFGAYTCEDCGYRPGGDPRVPKGSAARMLDAHHVEPLAGGERETTLEGLAVLCPLCHRRHHVEGRTPGSASKSADAVPRTAPAG